jgi:hypothetical protein
MHIGMLWFDNAPESTLKIKIAKAVEYYRRKYHREPNLCLIHPSMIGREHAEAGKLSLVEIEGMTVRPYRPVLPGHLWIGIEDKS